LNVLQAKAQRRWRGFRVDFAGLVVEVSHMEKRVILGMLAELMVFRVDAIAEYALRHFDPRENEWWKERVSFRVMDRED